MPRKRPSEPGGDDEPLSSASPASSIGTRDELKDVNDGVNGSRNGNGSINGMPPKKKPRLTREQRVESISDAMRTILGLLGENAQRDGLLKTPDRYAKAMLDLTSGYERTLESVVGDAQFAETSTEPVIVRDISVFSLCEHHLLPFTGVAHISYIPSGEIVIGLSKLARIVELFARRLQVQERLTNQIADAVCAATKATGVMVSVQCAHLCMSMRGVQKAGALTITTAVRGRYSTDSNLRQEFQSTIK